MLMWAFIPCELCSEGEWALPVAILEVSAWVGGFKSLCVQSSSAIQRQCLGCHRHLELKLKLLLMVYESIQNLVSGSSQLASLFSLPLVPSTTNILLPLFLKHASHIPISGLCARCPLSLDACFLQVSCKGPLITETFFGQL